MALRVLVVDDSRFFRRRVGEMLSVDKGIEVVGEAADGVEAVEQALKLRPDVISMDIEMPVLDGIAATKRILAVTYIPILMFSSLTNDGAKATFDALDAGAVDYLPKKFEEFANNLQEAGRKLCEKIRAVASARRPVKKLSDNTTLGRVKPVTTPRTDHLPVRTLHQANRTVAPPGQDEPRIRKGQTSLVAIGTSTGGPVALQKILCALPEDFSAGILLVQHMPSSFTGPFAQRLDGMCKIKVKEAADGDVIKPGVALLAPGGQQMEVYKNGDRNLVRIYPALEGQNYKPCIDLTFGSIATSIGTHAKILGIILTGMGADGCEGCLQLKKTGAQIWVQDEETSVVFGMPSSVVEAGGADYIYSIDNIATYLSQKV